MMLQLTPQSRVFLALEPADFRRGIDGLSALCRQRLGEDPFLCVEHEYAAASPKHAPRRMMAWRFACDRRRIISRDSRADSALDP